MRDTDTQGRRWRDHRATVTEAVAVEAGVQASLVVATLVTERIRVAAEWELAKCSIESEADSADN